MRKAAIVYAIALGVPVLFEFGCVGGQKEQTQHTHTHTPNQPFRNLKHMFIDFGLRTENWG